MIHMELGPSTILGLSLTLIGFLLYFVKTKKPSLSRDYDLFFSSVGLLCGAILIFQGWRLDPILLLCQIFSSATAIFFIGESLWLRNTKSKKKNPFQEKLFLKTPPFFSNQVDNRFLVFDQSEDDSHALEQMRIQAKNSSNSQKYLKKDRTQSYQEKKLILTYSKKTKSLAFNFTDPLDYAHLKFPGQL